MKKRIPIIISQWLRDLPFDEVVFWANFAKSKYFVEFEKFVFAEAERRKNMIWRLPEANPTVLAIEKAALRGGIEAIYNLVAVAKGANGELERRSEKAKS